MQDNFLENEFSEDAATTEGLGGTNFLVSAVLLLKEQKKKLVDENLKLKEQLEHFQVHHAALLDVNADRLLRKGL